METALQEIRTKFEEHLAHMDESALVILKGHLVIEETLTEIIDTFVHHGEQLEGARLTFAQKVALARSMSLDEYNNEMWQLVLAVNSLRNEMAHALQSSKRVTKTKALLDLHKSLGGQWSMSDGSTPPEHILLSFALSYSLGFLSGFVEEVRRFRSRLDEIDRLVNPHRHK